MLLFDYGDLIEENVPISNLRIRSRKATLSDCTCFLRPGLDICVLSTPQGTEDSSDDENQDPIWVDAKINSIERKPHEPKCTCQFYVSFYVTQGPLDMAKKTLSKETVLVQLDQISILQNLNGSLVKMSITVGNSLRIAPVLHVPKFSAIQKQHLVIDCIVNLRHKVTELNNAGKNISTELGRAKVSLKIANSDNARLLGQLGRAEKEREALKAELEEMKKVKDKVVDEANNLSFKEAEES
ncbi:uncharacterized protein LOC114321974 [Camellia sinensis]|uniref:uncharacterized protein LOC114321974 n=1 Tax=Camellia sinensis TaxID=4442 RepID=UPI001035FCDB|nr:uncharacterized protein LOC114321974 [Camellia sinensis]